MPDKRVWFITGAGRGMGVDIAQAALAAGHLVVATGGTAEASQASFRSRYCRSSCAASSISLCRHSAAR